MSSFYIRETINSIENESDVEQKFVYPWVNDKSAFGLGYSVEQILTKKNIKDFEIDKGTSNKRYYPDYILVQDQLPVMIIEAKSPNVGMEDGFREAQLYANRLNGLYDNNDNPTQHVLCINGKLIWYGKFDVAKPEIIVNMEVENFHLTRDFQNLVKIISSEKVNLEANKLIRKIKGNTKYVKPSFQLGSKNRRSAKIGDNSFGSNLALIYKGDFNPETKIERENIAKNAYVESKRREKHINKIERIITRGNDKHRNSHSIASDNKKIIINNITDENYKNQICLLIGGVGAGKSTFSDYLRYNKLDYDKSTFWININLNNCPPDKSEIFKWLIEEITSTITQEYKGINLQSIDFIEKIFSAEIASFKSGSISLFNPSDEQYKIRYADKIESLISDHRNKLNQIIKYLFIQKNIVPIIILDNCDKRDKERQLLMFEIANWIKDQFQCNILLPIRDTTYDLYKDEPPLDTVVKDLTFRIDPPLLQKVIESRLKYIRFKNNYKYSNFSYILSNGLPVQVRKEEVDTYLKAIVNSIFQDPFFRTIIVGLAGKNIRRGIEIVLDFCKSGYLEEDLILKIRTNNMEKIPPYLISLILLKGSRLYYTDEESKVKKLFHSEVDSSLPDPFVRISVLLFLKDKLKYQSDMGVKGYIQVEEILKSLSVLGHNRKDTINELKTLLRHDCLISESSLSDIDNQDYLKISSSGIVHLDMLSNVSYLSSIAEDTYFKDNETAKKIANNMKGDSVFSTNSHVRNLNSSKLLLDYLLKIKNDLFKKPMNIHLGEDIVENKIQQCLSLINRKIENNSSYDELQSIANDYKEGDLQLATITGIQQDCIFVEFNNFTGYIDRRDNLIFRDHIEDVMENGDLIMVEIIKYNKKHSKFDVKIDSF